jgi:hypothetical protein
MFVQRESHEPHRIIPAHRRRRRIQSASRYPCVHLGPRGCPDEPGGEEEHRTVYRRYEAELNRLGDEKLALINDYADNYKSMTDAKAGELTRKAIDLDILRTSLLQQYLPQFQKALTNRRAAQFYQIEMPLLKVVDLQIASKLPMMP